MTDGTTRWHSGDHLALVWDAGVALIDHSVPVGDAERIWHALKRDCSLGTFLEVLSETSGLGLLRLPPFAIVIHGRGTCHIAVRGGFVVSAQSAAGEEQFSGEGITTWFEKQIPAPDGFWLGESGPSGAGLPISDGIVLAGALARGASALAEYGGGDLSAAGSDVSPKHRGVAASEVAEFNMMDHVVVASQPDADGADHGDGGFASSDDVAEESVGRSAEASEPIAQSSVDELIMEADEDPDGFGEEPDELNQAKARFRETRLEDDADQLDPPELSASAVGHVGRYGSLWDASIAVSAEDAAVRDDGEESDTRTKAGRDPEAGPARDESRFIGGVPFSSSPTPPLVVARPAGEGSAPATDGMHDGHTVLAEDDDAPVMFEMPNPQSAPMVLASFCERGHANPPQRSQCRVCKGQVEGRTEQTPRPALGRIRLSSGEKIDLVGPIIAGRSPSARNQAGGAVARLVALPRAHISGNHLEITLEGWSVMVRDLHSTNGTFLRRHGQPPVRLPEHSLPLADGDVLDLGHGVFIFLEQLP